MRNRSEHFVDRTQPAGKIACNVQNHDCVLVRLMSKEVVEIGTFQRKKETVLDRPKRGSTGHAFDDRHLAQEISWSKGRENRFTRLAQMVPSLHPPWCNDEHSITRFVFSYDNLTCAKFRLFGGKSDLRYRVCIQSSKNRNGFQKLLACARGDHG